MKLARALFTVAILAFYSFSAVAEGEKEAVKSQCASEAMTAGCKDMEVGQGFIKCLHDYKKKNKKDFKFSDSCKEALRGFKAHRKELKK
ncbi:MAG: hypothetical protein L6Q37_11355 [Bdellovibrionaceae bacterium]|nr:hypothetical protein [Pseudobdellovibrionaceae bacterium]NUM58267.1 hypothetical protein [Pseudobdellovibrionaceae bacterium]